MRIFKKTLAGTLVLGAFVAFNHTAQAQLYSSGNNSISGNNVGIGASSPVRKLDVFNGDFIFTTQLSPNGTGNAFWFHHQYWLTGGSLFLFPANLVNTGSGVDAQIVNVSGQNVGWEFTHDGEFRSHGKIWAPEVEVKLPPFPDYVFEENYYLMSISEMEKYIHENGHLPGLPSAQEVTENGIGLGEMQTLLLTKIEELSLYVIELKKANEAIREDNAQLRTELSMLKQQ